MAEEQHGFEFFPSEIWASVACYLSGEQLGRCKLTGSKTLWQRLKTRNTVKSINLGKDSIQFKRWPQFLKELPSIDFFAIENEDDAWWASWSPKLNKMPFTLKKLRILGSPKSTADFFRESERDIFHLFECVPLLESLDLGMNWAPSFPWLSLTPPNLKIMSCADWYCGRALPRSLIHFTANYNIEITAKDDVQLPSGLQSLKTAGCSDFDLLIPRLPATLLELTVEGSMSLSTSMIQQLPRGLTSLSGLSFENSLLSDVRLDEDPKSVIPLPSTLTMLEAAYLPVQCWPHLPPTLRILTLALTSTSAVACRTRTHATSGNVNTFSTYPVDQLPRSITELKLHFDSSPLVILDPPISISASESYFPPHLTSLTLSMGQLSVEAAKQLPPSLTRLNTSHLDSSVCQHLPKGLTLLSADQVMASPNFIKSPPQSLTSS